MKGELFGPSACRAVPWGMFGRLVLWTTPAQHGSRVFSLQVHSVKVECVEYLQGSQVITPLAAR